MPVLPGKNGLIVKNDVILSTYYETVKRRKDSINRNLNVNI